MEEKFRSRFGGQTSRNIFGFLGRNYPNLTGLHAYFAVKTTFQALARDSADAYLHGVSIFPDEGRDKLFSDSFKRELQGYRSTNVYRRHLDGKIFEDPLRMVQYLDFKTYLPGDILTKVDRASMAHSLEVRVPFLDHKFVTWAAGVPTSQKLQAGSGKHVLKKSLEPLLPAEVLYRKKMGFSVPLDVWFRGSLQPKMTASLDDGYLAQSGIFDRDALHRIGQEHRSGKRDNSAILWALLMFDGFLGAADRQPGMAQNA